MRHNSMVVEQTRQAQPLPKCGILTVCETPYNLFVSQLPHQTNKEEQSLIKCPVRIKQLIHLTHLEKWQTQSEHSINLAVTLIIILFKSRKSSRKHLQKKMSTPNSAVCFPSTSEQSQEADVFEQKIHPSLLTPWLFNKPGQVTAPAKHCSGIIGHYSRSSISSYVTCISELFPVLQIGRNIYLPDHQDTVKLQ